MIVVQVQPVLLYKVGVARPTETNAVFLGTHSFPLWVWIEFNFGNDGLLIMTILSYSNRMSG